MNISLPPVLAQYFEASNTRSAEAYLSAFHDDAVVVDEGITHTGIEALRQWRSGVNSAFEYTVTPEEAVEKNGRLVVKALLVGTFPGSPVHLFYHFELKGERIAYLVISGE